MLIRSISRLKMKSTEFFLTFSNIFLWVVGSHTWAANWSVLIH
jgi:hypothetical protein